MRRAIFGATGRTGVHLVEQALAAGHAVTTFARTYANAWSSAIEKSLGVLDAT